MPKKPIKPDRVRIPLEWWNARTFNMAMSSAWLTSYFLAFRPFLNGKLQFPTIATAFLLYLPLAFIVCWNEYRVRKVWVKRIVKHDGLMCPKCAYPLTGIHTQHTTVTCPECGYLTEDCSQLFERWRKSVRSFYWINDKRLQNHKYKDPDD